MTDDAIPAAEPDPMAVAIPIEHLFTIDPLDLTEEDKILLVQHYRRTRLNFLKLEDKPKAVQKNRNPKLDAAASASEAKKMLSEMFGLDEDEVPVKEPKK